MKLKNKLFFILCLLFLSGCKEKSLITVFDKLPDSVLLSEVKASLENKKPLAIAFTAEWCPHCKKYKPVFIEVQDGFKDKITFINIDVDDTNGQTVTQRFQVKGIPTTAFIRKDGSVYKVQVGNIEKEELNNILDGLIKSKKKKRKEPLAPFPIDELQQEEKPVEIQEEKLPQELITPGQPGQTGQLGQPGQEEQAEQLEQPSQEEQSEQLDQTDSDLDDL